MRTEAILTLILPLIFINLSAQFNQVGEMGFTKGYSTWDVIKINPVTHEPYVAYKGADWKISVMKFNGNEWVFVGKQGISDGNSDGVGLAFTPEGTPYVTFQDRVNQYGTTVMKFDGADWQVVGQKCITSSASSFNTIAIDSKGIPYIAFRDAQDNNYGASVMRFNGTSWEFVGMRNFTDPQRGYGGASQVSITLDKNDVPYIAYQHWNEQFNTITTVAKFNGNDWDQVGIADFAGWNATMTRSMAFDSKNRPYLVCLKDGKTTAIMFENGVWSTIADFIPNLGGSEYATIAIDSRDNVYLAFQDYAVTRRLTVTRCSNGKWDFVGSQGFSPSSVQFVGIDIDKSDNVYINYADNSTGLWAASTVKFSDPTVSIKENSKTNSAINVYPNPAKNSISISFDNDNSTVSEMKLVNQQGAVILHKYLACCQTNEIDISTFAKGLYFVSVSTQNGVENRKLIIE